MIRLARTALLACHILPAALGVAAPEAAQSPGAGEAERLGVDERHRPGSR